MINHSSVLYPPSADLRHCAMLVLFIENDYTITIDWRLNEAKAADVKILFSKNFI